MKNEEKELLIKDLSARLPYGVIVQYKENTFSPYGEYVVDKKVEIDDMLHHRLKVLDFKPYLRPMASMTEKEVNELKMICDDYDLLNECGDVVSTIYGMTLLYGKEEEVYPYNLRIKISPNINYAVLDYLNERHFDYRGLIEKGLALEAPKEMYKE